MKNNNTKFKILFNKLFKKVENLYTIKGMLILISAAGTISSIMNATDSLECLISVASFMLLIKVSDNIPF